MSAHGPDDRAIRDVIAGGLALPALLFAHEVGLFERLADGPRTPADLAASLGLPRRSIDAVLALATAAGFLELDHGRPALGATARAFLLRASPTSWAGYLDLLITSADRYAYRGVRDALRSGHPPPDGLDAAERTLALERAMHDRGVVAARAWARCADLDGHARLLDVGGGSGVFAMEAVRRFPRLSAWVLDLAPVCARAAARIEAAGLSDRVRTHAADYLDASPFPPADAHLFAEVLHNRSADDARRLVTKSWAALPPGGRIFVHEMLLDDGPGPAAIAAANLNMALWTRAGYQRSRAELVALLTDVGFDTPTVTPVDGGYFTLVTGRKPR